MHRIPVFSSFLKFNLLLLRKFIGGLTKSIIPALLLCLYIKQLICSRYLRHRGCIPYFPYRRSTSTLFLQVFSMHFRAFSCSFSSLAVVPLETYASFCGGRSRVPCLPTIHSGPSVCGGDWFWHLQASQNMPLARGQG